jgi:hypothetical protein
MDTSQNSQITQMLQSMAVRPAEIGRHSGEKHLALRLSSSYVCSIWTLSHWEVSM